MFGHRGESRQHGKRVGPPDDVEVVDTAAMFAQSQALGQE
jgi:hypothetical protein